MCKKTGLFVLTRAVSLCFPVVLAAGLLMGCDLLLNKPEENLAAKIDSAVEYANAAAINVRIGVVPGTTSTVTAEAPKEKVGYPFTVRVTPNPAYAFVRWEAVPTEHFAAYQTGEWEVQAALAAEAAELVEITHAVNAEGIRTGEARVIVKTTAALTLVPYCADRPVIVYSNPPLIDAGISYSRAQSIRITFAVPLDKETVQFGAGFIEITGQSIGELGNLWDNENTSGNENGDLTGSKANTMRYFQAPVYDVESRTILIKPELESDSDETGLPPGDLVITVTVGTGITNQENHGMTVPQSFKYRTNTLLVKNVFQAENIWATHDPGAVTGEDGFFYTNAASGRDRRLRKNTDKYEVTLYYGISPSNADAMSALSPTHVKIVEYHYANLTGSTVLSKGDETIQALTTAEDGANSAGYFYGQSNGGADGKYKITYQLQSTTPGIYRLIVLPYSDTAPLDDFADVGDIAPDTWRNADAEGRFVTVVLDDLEPSGSAILSLSGYASETSFGGNPRYNYGSSNKDMTITANFNEVADNGGVGILPVAASMYKPWTMDNKENLRWKYQIEISEGTSYESGWLEFTAEPTLDLSTVPGISAPDTARTVSLKYRDSLGNESPGWLDSGIRVSYYATTYTQVPDWSADYGVTTINDITVKWTNPAGMDGVEMSYTIDGGQSGIQRYTGEGPKTHRFTGVPKINADEVRDGKTVSNVYGYTITLTAYNAYGFAAPVTVKIWNIPGMSVSKANPANEIGNPAQLAALTVTGAVPTSGKTYVLVNDITLEAGWTPVGIDTKAFQGKFYGNGHTITVNGNLDTAKYTGIFGYVNGTTAEIRDLGVHYSGDTSIGTSATHVGGLAGYAGGGVKIRNVTVSGAGTLTYSASRSATYTGGIAGQLVGVGSLIENCYGGLSLKSLPLISNGIHSVGGIVGNLDTAGITDCVWTADIDIPSQPGGTLYAGGIAGYFTSSATVTDTANDTPRIKNVRARGNISVTTTNVTTFVGGLTGQAQAANTVTRPLIDDSSYEGGCIEVECSGSSPDAVGGIAGQFGNTVTVEGGDLHEVKHVGPVITKSFSRAKEIHFTQSGNGSTYFGGFIGAVYATDISGCFSESPLTMSDALSATYLYVGGFIGDMITVSGQQSKIISCYANVALQITGLSPRVGGLIGNSFGDSGDVSVSKCYATGTISSLSAKDNVSGGLIGLASYTAISESWASCKIEAKGQPNNSNYIYAGGLVGNLSAGSKIENSYALGDVLADDPSTTGGNVYAGGIVGSMSPAPSGYSPEIHNSFAKGSVTAQTNSGSDVYAGGIAGFLADGGGIQECVALGKTIIAKGTSTKIAASRIYGRLTLTSDKVSFNFALDSMKFGTYDMYSTDNESLDPPPDEINMSDSSGRHGGDVIAEEIQTWFFWISTSMLHFNPSIWDFTHIASTGSPTLVHAGGVQ